MTSLWLALQFFTSFPIRKEFSLNNGRITAMYALLPWVGAIIGCVLVGVYFSSSALGFSPLLSSILLLTGSVALTGGLHLDGVADTSDAYFSYRDTKRRHEILDDPRIGAFGVLGLIIIILLKFGFSYEWVHAHSDDWFWLIIVPFLARGAMVLYFISLPPAKESGLAYFFFSQLNRRVVLYITIGSLVSMLLFIGFVINNPRHALVLAIVIGFVILLYRSWSNRNFGGVTGDLSGSFIEGMEVIVWMTVLSLS